MKAFQVDTVGHAAALVEINRKDPKAGEVEVKIAACGVNFGDLLLIDGKYQEKPNPPFVLGMEISGTITRLGPAVDGLQIGDRVVAYIGHGGMAEFATIDATLCAVLPSQMPFDDAAAFAVAYGTSHLGLARRAMLKSSDRLLVLGAGGGVGLSAVEIGARMGAEVIACARGRDKLNTAKKMGATHLIDTSQEDLRSAALALGGADVVYDPVGGDQFKAAFRACNPEARILSVGFASGQVPDIALNHMLVKNISVIGYYWGGYQKFAPKVLRESLETLLMWYEQGALHPHISQRIPLDQAQYALDLVRDRKSIGKVVITMQ